MKKFIGLSLFVLSLFALPATGSAESMSGHGANRVAAGHHSQGKSHKNKWRRWHHEKGLPATCVPELDPGAAANAFALLFVGTALMIDRRRAARV